MWLRRITRIYGGAESYGVFTDDDEQLRGLTMLSAPWE